MVPVKKQRTPAPRSEEQAVVTVAGDSSRKTVVKGTQAQASSAVMPASTWAGKSVSVNVWPGMLEFYGFTEWGPVADASWSRLRTAGLAAASGKQAKLPGIAQKDFRLTSRFINDGGQAFGLSWGSGLTMQVQEARLSRLHGLASWVQVWGSRLKDCSLCAARDNVAELMNGVIGYTAAPCLNSIEVCLELGIPAEEFFRAFQARTLVCPGGRHSLDEGPAACLRFWRDSVELLIAKATHARGPMTRVVVRIGEKDLGENFEIHSIEELARDCGEIVGDLVKYWCRWSTDGSRRAPLHPLWCLIPQSFTAWGKQLAATQGRRLILRANLPVDAGVSAIK